MRVRLLIVTLTIVLAASAAEPPPPDERQAQTHGTTGHEHLTEVACVDMPPGEKRPEFGCFNVGTVKELQFRRGGRLLASLHVWKQKGCRGGQECDRNRCGGRRPRVAL